MNKEHTEKMSYIVDKLSRLKSVDSIFLFGSSVNGNVREDSDIDIAVLVKKGTSRADELRIIGYGSDIFDISIFHRLPLIIQFRVLKEGRVLFCRDKKTICDVKVDVFRRYLDFSYFINGFYRRVLKNV